MQRVLQRTQIRIYAVVQAQTDRKKGMCCLRFRTTRRKNFVQVLCGITERTKTKGKQMRNEQNFMCCFNCKDREIGCHSKCVKYKEAKQVWAKKEEENRKQNYLDGLLNVSKWKRRKNGER